MAVVCQIGAASVQRHRFHCQLIEEYRLEQAEELTPQEAVELLPGFDRAVARNRVAISWREFGAPSPLPIGAGEEE